MSKTHYFNIKFSKIAPIAEGISGL